MAKSCLCTYNISLKLYIHICNIYIHVRVLYIYIYIYSTFSIINIIYILYVVLPGSFSIAFQSNHRSGEWRRLCKGCIILGTTVVAVQLIQLMAMEQGGRPLHVSYLLYTGGQRSPAPNNNSHCKKSRDIFTAAI